MDIPITIRILTALLLLFPSVTLALLPNGQCSVRDMACQLESDNVIGIINGVTSAEECKMECEDESNNCKVYSHYGPDGSPFVDSCLLFNNCEVLEPVDDCFTEEVECSRYCNAPIEGVLGDNLINFVTSVSEAACEAGRRFNRKQFGLSFGLKNGLRFHFDSETCLNYPFLNIFLV